MIDAALPLVRPDGVLVYSVCTVTEAETRAIDDHLHEVQPLLRPLAQLDPPWRPCGRGNLLLPHDAGTDGMYVLRLRLPSRADG